ncbi:MAG: diguanylate cyclase [Polyangiales bacterium]
MRVAEPPGGESSIDLAARPSRFPPLLSRVDRTTELEATVLALSATFDAVPDPAYLLLVEPDWRFRIVAVNAAYVRTARASAPDLVGRTVDTMTPGASISLQHYRRAVEERAPVKYTRRLDSEQGPTLLEVTTHPILDSHGKVRHLLCITRDVTEASLTRTRVDFTERLGRAVLDSLHAPLAVLDAEGRIVSRNSAWVQVAKAHPAGCWRAVQGESLATACEGDGAAPGADAHGLAIGIANVLSGEAPSFACDYRTSDTSPSWWRAHVVPLSLSEGGAVISFTDISDSKAAVLELSHAATHDNLTGLPNRELFHQRLDESLLAPEQSVAVAFVDVDEFKAVNDHFGHEVGDQLLCEIARRLRSVVRGCDTVARYAGDEFVILLSGFKGPESLEECGTRIVEAFASPFQFSECVLTVGVSVGLAAGRAGSSEGSIIVRRADEAMYRAKNAGKNRFVINGR